MIVLGCEHHSGMGLCSECCKRYNGPSLPAPKVKKHKEYPKHFEHYVPNAVNTNQNYEKQVTEYLESPWQEAKRWIKAFLKVQRNKGSLVDVIYEAHCLNKTEAKKLLDECLVEIKDEK